jgi:hypothetical protein
MTIVLVGHGLSRVAKPDNAIALFDIFDEGITMISSI